MANPWFRLYAEFADDPKVLTMPEALQLRLVKLMCLRCKDETLDETFQAFQWRISPEEMAETKKLFLARGFIDEEWNLLNWNRRQFISDSSTERVRQYRERMKRSETLQKQEKPEDFTGDETGGNVTETKGNVTVTAPEQSRTDSETDSEQRQIGLSVRTQAKASAKSLSQAVNEEAAEDLSEWVDRIAVAYPKNKLKNLGALEVYPADKPSIVDAILAEATKAGVTASQAAEMLLAMVDALAETVPREDWNFLPRMTDYFARFEYRRDPETFKRARGGASNGKRRSNNEEAFRGFIPEPVTSASDGEGVEAAGGYAGPRADEASGGSLSGVPVGVRGTGVDPDVHAGNGRVQVLPATQYPPRVQWPSRHR